MNRLPPAGWKALAIAAVLVVVVSCGVVAKAQGSIEVVSDKTATDFPNTLTFSLQARSASSITRIEMDYTVDRQSCARIVNVAFPNFQPGTSVNAQWALQTKMVGGLPPGTRFAYQWIIQDSSGNRLETQPKAVSFDDTRHNWRQTTQGPVTIHWYSGSDSFAKQLMDAAQTGLQRMGTDAGAQLDRQAQVYVYNGISDLRSALIFPTEYTGGLAYSNFNIVTIGVGEGDLAFGKGAIAHELAHLLVERAAHNCYNNIPSWLNEGLATHAEGAMRPEFQQALNQAVSKDGVFPLASLVGSFPALASDATLAYAESRGVVDYLINTQTKGSVQKLLQSLQGGISIDDALKSVYGFDMFSLDNAWRQSLGLKPRPTPTPSPQPSAHALSTLGASVRGPSK